MSRLPHVLACTLALFACATSATPPPSITTAHAAEIAAEAPTTPHARQRGVPERGEAPGVAVGAHGAVASAEPVASDIGLTVLRRGGNAVDAAIAVAFALAVTHPSAGNLGGGGFMLVRLADGASTAIDYREVAPAEATADMYLDAKGEPTNASYLGARAAGIPGTVAGLAHAHARFGTLPWAELVAPAEKLAREGHVLDAWHAESMAGAAKRMLEAGFASSAAVYLDAARQPLPEGALWRQPELAATLQAIAAKGPRAFYEGPLAARIVSGVRQLGGIWSEEDLRNYRVVEREPLRFDYRGHTVITMPPPSSGGIVMRQLLAASELLGIYQKPYRSAEAFHLYAEAARRAFADRNTWIADPDVVKVPTAKLTSLDYIRARMADIDPARATPSSRIAPGVMPDESPQTTHFSVVDDAGNAVSNTYTLNSSFGAKVVAPGTGILLNNEMDDFTAKPGAANVYGLVQGARNAIAPGKRMLSSMTPTILTKDDALRAVIGSPGGPTIINTVTEILMAVVDHGQRLDAAVLAPRVHHQWLPDAVTVEKNAEPALIEGLRARGHTVGVYDTMGHANCIEVDPSTRGFRAVADVTRDGGGASAY